jgi:hypothetical protein
MNQEARQALTVLLPAMVTAAAVLLAAWRPWQRAARVEHGDWGGALAVGLGFIAAFYFVAGARGFQLHERWHWLWMIANAAMALGVVASFARANSLMKILSGTALAGATGALFMPPGSAANPVLWKAGLGASVLMVWMMSEPLAQRRRGVAMPIAMVIVLAGLSIIMLQTRQAGYSLLAAALSAMCGVATVIALLNPRFTFANGAMHVLSAMLASLCAIGWLYNFTDVPVWPFALLIVSPLMMWVGELPRLARLRPWQRAGITVAVATIPVAIAVGWAVFVIESGVDETGY